MNDFGALGAHVMTLAGIQEALKRWKPPVIVAFDDLSEGWNDVRAACPNSYIVARANLPQQFMPGRGMDPKACARADLENTLRIVDEKGTRSAFNAFQGTNEPAVENADQMRELAAYDCWRIAFGLSHGVRVAVGAFSTGCPRLNLWAHYLPALREAVEHGAPLLLHEYSKPVKDEHDQWHTVWDGWMIGRFVKVWYGEPAEDWPGLPEDLQKRLALVLAEFGLDNDGKNGWRSYQTAESHRADLKPIDARLQAYQFVLGAALFCWNNRSNWPDYDIAGALVDGLIAEAKPVYRPLPRPGAGGPPPSQPAPASRTFRRPFEGRYRVTATFDDHRNRKPPSATPGIDYALPANTPVLAPRDGKVLYWRWSATGGRYLVLQHDQGYISYFYHLRGATVAPGESVKAGQQIGLSGNTGSSSTGPHLHWAVKQGAAWIDPARLC